LSKKKNFIERKRFLYIAEHNAEFSLNVNSTQIQFFENYLRFLNAYKFDEVMKRNLPKNDRNHIDDILRCINISKVDENDENQNNFSISFSFLIGLILLEMGILYDKFYRKMNEDEKLDEKYLDLNAKESISFVNKKQNFMWCLNSLHEIHSHFIDKFLALFIKKVYSHKRFQKLHSNKQIIQQIKTKLINKMKEKEIIDEMKQRESNLKELISKSNVLESYFRKIEKF
jgi:hypothetical protein